MNRPVLLATQLRSVLQWVPKQPAPIALPAARRQAVWPEVQPWELAPLWLWSSPEPEVQRRVLAQPGQQPELER